jgi:hypothetical protein
MVRIAISQAAFDAVAATLVLGTIAVEPERDEDGSVHIWLDPDVLARLKVLRWPRRELQRRHFQGREGREWQSNDDPLTANKSAGTAERPGPRVTRM